MTPTPTPSTPPIGDEALLAAARGGDEQAFGRLVEPYRGELQAHCYRMLGALQDSEDALQDSLLRAWRGLPGFERRSSLRSWLYSVATNSCIDLMGRRPKRVLPFEHGPPGDPRDELAAPITEPVWLEPYPDELLDAGEPVVGPAGRYELRESVELAFGAALQHLPARQRAVLILRDALGFSAKEVAEALETTVGSVTSALQRARASIEDRLPAESQQANLRSIGDNKARALVEGYVAAWEAADVDGVVALLTEDVALEMPPIPTWYRGREDAAEFFGSELFSGDHRDIRLLPTRANGQLAFGAYNKEPGADHYTPMNLHVLQLRGDRIAEIYAFLTADMHARFGLPERLD